MAELLQLELKYPTDADSKLKMWTAFTNLSWPDFEDLSEDVLKTVVLNSDLFLVPTKLYERILESKLSDQYHLPKNCQPVKKDDSTLEVDSLLRGGVELNRFGVQKEDIANIVKDFLSWPFHISSLSGNRNTFIDKEDLSFYDLIMLSKAVAARKHIRNNYDFNVYLTGHQMDNSAWEGYEDKVGRIAIKSPLVNFYEADKKLREYCETPARLIYESSRLLIPDDDSWISVDEILVPIDTRNISIKKFFNS